MQRHNAVPVRASAPTLITPDDVERQGWDAEDVGRFAVLITPSNTYMFFDTCGEAIAWRETFNAEEQP